MDFALLLVLWILMKDSLGGVGLSFEKTAGLFHLLFLATAISGLAGLAPRRVYIAGRSFSTDGHALLHLLRASPQQLAALVWRQQWARVLAMQKRTQPLPRVTPAELEGMAESNEMRLFKEQAAKLKTALLNRGRFFYPPTAW